MDLSKRYLGSLLGMATGDAVGTTCEFERPGTFKPASEMVGGGPFKLKAGEWTDDTSMGLCLAESLISCGKFEPVDQLQRYVKWFRTGHLSSNGRCFDIGATVRAALLRFEKTGKPYCGDTNPQTAGNGSLMRLTAVPLYFAADPTMAIELAGDSSRTTHGSTIAVDACRYFAGLIIGALNGVSKDELLAPRYSPVPQLWETGKLCAEIDAIALGSYKKQMPPFIQGTGYAAKSLEAALWAFETSDNFKTGCLKAVNLGNDADTTAAIYGQLAGAYYGVDGIPSYWLKKLAKRDVIESFALKLFDGSRDVGPGALH
ncbi:MAG: ADP-ribosylglycohydrolase family protein [Candidatus Obscuribacterales bacterium]|jgi:ADP-ribosylglycohydrolase